MKSFSLEGFLEKLKLLRIKQSVALTFQQLLVNKQPEDAKAAWGDLTPSEPTGSRLRTKTCSGDNIHFNPHWLNESTLKPSWIIIHSFIHSFIQKIHQRYSQPPGLNLLLRLTPKASFTSQQLQRLQKQMILSPSDFILSGKLSWLFTDWCKETQRFGEHRLLQHNQGSSWRRLLRLYRLVSLFGASRVISFMSVRIEAGANSQSTSLFSEVRLQFKTWGSFSLQTFSGALNLNLY